MASRSNSGTLALSTDLVTFNSFSLVLPPVVPAMGGVGFSALQSNDRNSTGVGDGGVPPLPSHPDALDAEEIVIRCSGCWRDRERGHE